MYLSKFSSSIKKAEENSTINLSSLSQNINSALKKIFNYVQNIKRKNPDIPDEEVLGQLHELNKRLQVVGLSNEYTLNEVSAYNACLYLLKNPQKYDEVSTYVNDNNLKYDKNFFQNTNNFNDNLVNLYLFVNHLYEPVLQNVEMGYGDTFGDIVNLPISKQEKRSAVNKVLLRLPLAQRKPYMDAFNLLLEGLPEYMKTYLDYIENNLRKDLISSNTELVSIFDEMGYLDDWISISNVQFAEIGLPELRTNKSALLSRFSPEVQKSYDTVDLLGINIMYTNRALHILENYSKAMYAIYEFNLEPTLLRGKQAPEIDKDSLKSMLIKSEFFYAPAEAFYCENDKIIAEMLRNGDIASERSASGIKSYSIQPLTQELEAEYSGQYKKYFSRLLPASKNDIVEDFRKYSVFANPIHLLKQSKNQTTFSLISLLQLANDPKRNFGIVLDYVSKDGTIGEIRHFLDFAVDIGCTLPVNVHLPSHVFKDFTYEYFGSPIFPIYKGSKDWDTPNGRRIKSHIMMPWDKNSIKTMKQCSKNHKCYSQRLVDHFRFLSDRNCIPQHFKKSPKDKFIDKTYINLETGSILEQTKEGVYLKVLPEDGEPDVR